MSDASTKFFLPYQKKWIEDRSSLKIAEKSRQIGFSWATAFSAVRRCAVKGARLDVWVSSRDDTQAKLFLEDCKAWAKVMQIAAEDLGERVVDKETGATAYVLQFASGVCIFSLSSNPNALAGKRGHVILDEYALHKDQRLLYRIAKPVTMWGGQLEIISTHRGASTVFNQIVSDIKHRGNKMGWSHHKVTIHDAVEQGLVEKINAKSGRKETREEFLARLEEECLDQEQWQQEYNCVPMDESSAFITYDMITSCEYEANLLQTWATDLDLAKELFVGVDVGRDHDLTAIWVLERVGMFFFTRRVIVLSKETFEAQEHALYTILQKPNVRRCCIDQTGLGRQFAERAIQRFGRYKVEGIHFTGAVKEELAYPVRAAFEERRLRIPRDEKIRSDIRAIRKETTLSGNIRFVAESGENGHSDRFWALALALHAGKTPNDCGAMVG